MCIPIDFLTGAGFSVVVAVDSGITNTIRVFFAGIAQPVQRVWLFGSLTRGTDYAESDVDLLMELESPVGYLKIIEIKQALEDQLRRKVDLLTPAGVSPRILKCIEKDRVLIYENIGPNSS